jgi:hypothetical protein
LTSNWSLHTPRAEPNSVAVGTTGKGVLSYHSLLFLSPGYIDITVNKPVYRQEPPGSSLLGAHTLMSLVGALRRIHPLLFLLAIVLIAVIQFASNVIVINNEWGEYRNNVQSMMVPPPFSSSGARRATSGTDDNIRQVICDELLQDPTIWDPSKLNIFSLLDVSFYGPLSCNFSVTYCATPTSI